MLQEILQKYWHTKEIKKWEYLYKASKNDQNLYFIQKWQILLSANWNQIAIVWENEISWEKSFLNKTPKPIDAQAITDLEVIFLSPEDFEKLDNFTQKEILKALTLFVSDRVYLLNNIVNNISVINKKISTLKPSLSLEYLQELFWNLFNIQEAYIYKIYEWAILPILESNVNPQVQLEIQKVQDKQRSIIWGKDYFLIKVDDYIFYGKIQKYKSDYVITNTFIHSIHTLKYLWEILEKLKDEELHNLIK